MASAGGDATPYRSHSGPASGPRRVPLGLRVRMVLGNRFAMFAWFALMFGSVMAWRIAGDSPLFIATIQGPTATTMGRVDDVSIHRSRGNETTREVRYRFTVAGAEYWGLSWDKHENAHVGDQYTVEYQIDDPRRSVIIGMTQTRFRSKTVGLVVALSGLAGVLLGGIGWVRARRAGRLLVYGRLAARAQLVDSTALRKSSDREVRHAYELESGEKHTCTTRVSKHFPAIPGTPANVLYHPADPSVALVVVTLPGAPTIVDGQIEPGRWPRRISLALGGLVLVNLAMAGWINCYGW